MNMQEFKDNLEVIKDIYSYLEWEDIDGLTDENVQVIKNMYRNQFDIELECVTTS